MAETPSESIALVVTSPPYWHIKDYGVPNQIGYGQSLHKYLYDLSRVWHECWRVLKPGRRLCINVGDQFARATVYGQYKVIPLHAEIIAQCETIGFDYLGAIIWQKKTTMRPSGDAVVMGSFLYPPNGIVELDYEYILLSVRRYVIGKRVILRFDPLRGTNETPTPAYLYLTNRLFVNRKMIEMGLAHADRNHAYCYRERFIAAEGKQAS